jgi:hypothetical protein
MARHHFDWVRRASLNDGATQERIVDSRLRDIGAIYRHIFGRKLVTSWPCGGID